MPRIQLPIANGSYQSQSLPISAQQCINWYPNIPQAPSLSQETLLGTPGLTQIATTGLTNQANRGSHVKAGKPYFLNGGTLQRLDQDGEDFTFVSLGNIPGNDRAFFADNGTQLMVVAGGEGYIIDEAAIPVFQQITDLDFKASGDPTSVVFIDSFFVCTTDSKKFIKSAANDGLNWNALDFGSAEADPDKIVAAQVFRNRLYIAGSETIEPFQNLGVGGFPFQRVQGGVIQKGVFAPNSMIEANNTFMFIGGSANESAAVWAISGNQPQKISTTAIDTVLQGYTQEELEQSFSFSYAQNGAYFVGFSFPDKTFVFDTITGRWHERESNILDGKGFTSTIRWRANSVANAYGLLLAADSQDGRIGVVEPDTYTEYGRNIIRTVTTQPFADTGNVMTPSQLELTVESGVGDFSITDPVVRLSYSDDAKTFSNEVSRGMGKIGEYNHRAIWRRLGRVPRFRVYRFVMSDPVKPVIIKLEANMRGHTIGN